jgi:hypothetical protein
MFQPKIYYLLSNKNSLKPNEVNLLSPINLIKEIDRIFNEKGESFFYKGINNNEIENNIYLNIIFYFELFDLPLCVLFVENDMDKFEKIKNQLKENLERKNILKKKKKKDFNMTFNSNEWNLEINQNLIGKNNNNANLKNIKEQFNIIMKQEKEIWNNIQVNILENKDNNKFNNVQIEDKSEILSFMKELKEYISDSLNYFINNSENKLSKFLFDLEKQNQRNAINLIMTDDIDGQSEKNRNKYSSVSKHANCESPEIKKNKKMFEDFRLDINNLSK